MNIKSHSLRKRHISTLCIRLLTKVDPVALSYPLRTMFALVSGNQSGRRERMEYRSSRLLKSLSWYTIRHLQQRRSREGHWSGVTALLPQLTWSAFGLLLWCDDSSVTNTVFVKTFQLSSINSVVLRSQLRRCHHFHPLSIDCQPSPYGKVCGLWLLLGKMFYITSCVSAKAQSIDVDIDRTLSEQDCSSELAIRSKVC